MLASAPDQDRIQVGPISPVARLVDICQGGAVNAVAKFHEVLLSRVVPKSKFAIVQDLATSQLCKNNDAKLLAAGHTLLTIIAAKALHDSGKACPWNENNDLRKQCLAEIQRKHPRSMILGIYARM